MMSRRFDSWFPPKRYIAFWEISGAAFRKSFSRSASLLKRGSGHNYGRNVFPGIDPPGRLGLRLERRDPNGEAIELLDVTTGGWDPELQRPSLRTQLGLYHHVSFTGDNAPGVLGAPRVA